MTAKYRKGFVQRDKALHVWRGKPFLSRNERLIRIARCTKLLCENLTLFQYFCKRQSKFIDMFLL